jgi:asparagine synthase (glutamine-hydrolysing)
MCGIAGFFGRIAGHPGAAALLDRMTASLAHRGPDGRGAWLGDCAGLGHARLAIIDLEGGAQPMWSSDGRWVIVFNGEIYNYRELKSELDGLGYRFRTRSDTETIWAAVDAWGPGRALARLRGMFAFALYEVGPRRLLLARDRVGIKPLYWAETPEGVVFGSEQKALLASGLVDERLDPVAVHDFLGHGYPTTPATCWAGISMLPPGSWLELTPGGRRSARYWEWRATADFRGSVDEAMCQAWRTLADAARCHLIADVPVGAFLSGGLDSSLMVALLSRSAEPPLRTFTMGFGDPAYDESAHARRVAERCGTRHTELRMEPGEADPELFCRVLCQYDEPFGDSSCLPVYLMCREMRKHVKVVLSGDGGDETFGGYPRYLHARRLAAAAKFGRALGLLAPAMRIAGARFGRSGHRANKAWLLARMPAAERLCALLNFFSEEERLALYRPEFAARALAAGPTAARFAAFLPKGTQDAAQRMIAAEMSLRLHADYLRKVDVASSAHGLEVRVPYLDAGVLEFAASLPLRFKMSLRGETKILSRRLARELLPDGLAERPKQGFDVPLDRWAGPRMRRWLGELLLEPGARLNAMLEPAAVREVWRAFEDPAAAGGLSRYQRHERVFLLASLELWLRNRRPAME